MFYKLQDIDLSNTTPEEIGELLVEAKKVYYTTGSPIMDDATYDTLEDILRKSLPYHRIFTKVGNDNFDTGFAKKAHHMAMGSQNKVKTFVELKKYFDRVGAHHDALLLNFVVQPKLDGLSVELVYQTGKFIEAITRGDGQIGDVITQNVVKMQNLRQKIDPAFSGSIRAEIVVTNKDFKSLPNSYTNPRNAASGISQRLDSLYCEFCTLLAYDLSGTIEFVSEFDKITFFKLNNIQTIDTVLCQSYEEIEQIYTNYLVKKRQESDFDLDGLVVKINDLKLSDSLGFQNGRPLAQVAYKFPSQSLETKIVDITWQVGPLGTVTPVAQVEPIEVAGAVITYASLANHDLIIEKNLNIGDIVELSRRGDVIPYVEKVVVKVTPGHLSPPTSCPSCASALIKDNKYLRCKNKSCPAQILGQLNLFCKVLDIKNISDKTIKKLNDIGKLFLPGDFYKLSISDIAQVDGLGEKSAKNIIEEIQAKKNLSLEQIFTAASIPDCSQKRLRQLISADFSTPQKLLNVTKQELLSLSGIQENLATRIVEGIAQRKNSINSILEQVTIKEPQTKNILNAAVFCITGALSAPRKQIEEQILAAGGRIANTVSRNTTYLVTNEPDSGSSKLEQASRFGTKIISEAELIKMLQ